MTRDGILIARHGRRAVVSLVVVLGLLTSACANSSPSVHSTYTLGHFPAVPTGSFAHSTAGAFQSVLDAAVKRGLPGITATVLAADGQAWSGAAGTADGMHPVEVSSQFGIASITKTVIAAEIMRLSEKGLLRLNDPVSKHLPSTFHFDTNGATVENLLHMESGIPDPAPSSAALAAFYGQTPDPLRAWTPQEVLATVPADRSKPGDHFVYEDANYMLLGWSSRKRPEKAWPLRCAPTCWRTRACPRLCISQRSDPRVPSRSHSERRSDRTVVAICLAKRMRAGRMALGAWQATQGRLPCGDIGSSAGSSSPSSP